MLRLEVPEGRNKILLHCCCAPCSGAVVECMVQNGLRPTLFFSNSNIVPKGEYDLRRGELERYASIFGLDVVDDDYDHDAWCSFVLNDPAMADAPERGPRCLECFKFRLLRAARYAAANGFDVLTTTLASSRWKSLDQVDAAGLWACRQIDAPRPFGVHGDNGCGGQRELIAGIGTPLVRRDVPESLSDDSGGFGGNAPRPLGVQGDNRSETSKAVLYWPVNWRKCGLQPRRSEIICEQQFYNQTFCGCEFSRRQEL